MARYVDVEPYFENTIMQESYNDANVLRGYRIAPAEGYVLHSNTLDTPVFDEVTGEETGETILGYRRGWMQVGYNYDFDVNPFEIYAVPEDTVPADQIFGGGNDHEVM